MVSEKGHFILLLLVPFLVACGSQQARGCDRLSPQGFSESEVLGTWDALDSLNDSTIVIRADGLYRQTMHVKRTGFQYASDWRAWRVTYSKNGLPYLHLERFLMCAYWREISCTENNSGEAYWYDSCQEKWVETPGEAVFMVFGDYQYKQDARRIRLVPFTKSSDGTTGPTYYLREP